MFRRILIANRGEIAVRIIRACRQMGITSVAIYSTADRDSLHVHLADEAICIGPPEAVESYLKIPSIIAAAEVANVQAIHPGYGFLSENARFAAICRECKLGWIGPSPEAMALSGDKAACRQAVAKAGVPVVPGSEGIVQTVDEAVAIAEKLGYPVLVKAAHGGGGKGMRIALNEAALKHAVGMAQNEAAAAFGNAGVYLEKFIDGARHIEVQVLGDNTGRIIALGERECTIQRRHQKLIEETPSPALGDTLRAKMLRAGVKAARAIGYTSAGTAEFLLAPSGYFYFIEFNARIQVEHTITEEVTGIDLVREQIRLATGEPLGYTQVVPEGSAIQARIYAEDPDHHFQPCPGRVDQLHLPGGFGVRVDTYLYAGCDVPRYYDSLVAKVIARGRDRFEAIDRLSCALDEVHLGAIRNTAGLCARILRGNRFRQGDITPDLIDEYLPRSESS